MPALRQRRGGGSGVLPGMWRPFLRDTPPGPLGVARARGGVGGRWRRRGGDRGWGRRVAPSHDRRADTAPACLGQTARQRRHDTQAVAATKWLHGRVGGDTDRRRFKCRDNSRTRRGEVRIARRGCHRLVAIRKPPPRLLGRLQRRLRDARRGISRSAACGAVRTERVCTADHEVGALLTERTLGETL